MSVIAKFSVPATAFPLGRALGVPDADRVELEAVVPAGRTPVPYVWATTDRPAAVAREFRASDHVVSVKLVDDLDDEALYRITWQEDVEGVLTAIVDTCAAILEATGDRESWTFDLRFESRETLAGFHERLVDTDVPLRLDEVHSAAATHRHTDYGLTDRQSETLLAALDAGYFDVPRTTTLEALGDDLDVSDSAASQRLRRGLETLVTATLEDTRHRL
jgi:predicted DNA binding protein